eukprot:CAMPEP_0185540952 /NCGR_PEP_ID=MMETSP1381-20130426/1664_1 /TAXON_ID=298111 /ORGANISM="Pavlova sp., Strain CCMP459" /LENGTH=205 /DNA_ID=CAMNT_0028152847 /DNA_START=319 /DNA_END=934 /DNA_ORIENTATION=+
MTVGSMTVGSMTVGSVVQCSHRSAAATRLGVARVRRARQPLHRVSAQWQPHGARVAPHPEAGRPRACAACHHTEKALPKSRLVHLKALKSELERATRRDSPRREARGAVPLVGRDDELPVLTHLHAEASLVPTSDHLTNASLVGEGLLPGVVGDQNFLPVSLTTPVACTVARSPLSIWGPSPGFLISNVVLCPGMVLAMASVRLE